MTAREMETIKDNLRSYEHNFGYIKIEKENYGDGFYVYTSEERVECGNWTQYCYNIDYLNGWLYGCVQAANRIMKSVRPTPKEEDEMQQSAGYREKYAMYNGQSEVITINNHRCYKFTYSENHEYQDANGATFDTVTKTWIN